MRRLLLLRHAKTERDSASGRDRDRALDARGRDDATAIGTWLSQQPDPPPGRVMVSTALRARQTWELLPQALRTVPVEHRDDLYGATTGELLDIIRTVDGEPETLLVIAHNPGLHELALALAGGGDAAARQELSRNLPTGSLVEITFPAAEWLDIALQSGTLTTMMTPKLLRAQSGA